MVDISSQNNKINITVSSSSNISNVNATPDSARYYSDKSKEWAISEKIVNNEDYSSKYYANESKKQADISTAKTTEVIESGNNAVSNIESARDNAITDITNQENLSVDNVNTAGITQVANINSAGTTQVNLAKEQVTLATNKANIATEQATIATSQASIATSKTTEVVESGNTALSNIETAKSNALNDINTTGAEYVNNAEQYAQNALNSANNAKTSEDNALSYKNSAMESSQTATEQASIAVTNANKAITSANNAKTSETNARSSEVRCEEILSRLGTAIKIKGRVDSIGDLPLGDNLDGDTYLVGEEGLDSYPEYYWYQDHWEFLGTTGTSLSWGLISGDITAQTDLQTALDSKQDKGNYALKSEIPTKTSQLTNDSGFINNDSTFVHKTGNETIAGVKTFSSTINGNTTSANYLSGFASSRNVFWAGTNSVPAGGTVINGANSRNGGSYVISEHDNKMDLVIDGKFYQDEGKYQVLDTSTGVTHTANTAVGSATKPVYINANGVATAITSYEGNSATATKATQDGNGNNIVNTYATKASLNTKANTSLSNLTDAGKQVIKDNSGSGLEVCDIGMALYVDETKGLRRYLNGQIVDINTNTQAFFTRLQKITTLHPSLLCTEEEWQTAKTMSAFGQVGKFVFNYSGDEIVSVRIPRVVNVQGLFDLQNLGMTVGQALPSHTHARGTMNITGGFTSRGIENINMNGWGAFNAQDSGDGLSYGHDRGPGGGFNFDASRSWTGSTSAPNYSGTVATGAVQQEAVQYPYFIQIATGQETENNITNEIELNTPSFFGDSKYVPTKVNNLSWLKSEGQNNPKGTYPPYYDWILENVNKGEKGFKLSTATDITDYDFVINTADETFRLPLLNGSENLPSDRYIFNIISNSITTTQQAYTAPANGWVYIKGHQTTGGSIYAHIRTPFGVETSCSGAGAAVNSSFKRFVKRGDTLVVWSDGASFNNIVSYFQYAQGNGSLYYYVGETVQNANLIDAGRIGEQLATKEDINTWVYYQNGTSGYRYNRRNGYCEQWGQALLPPSGTTVNLLKTYKNKDYNLVGIFGGTTVREQMGVAEINTKNSFKIYHEANLNAGFCLRWKTSGYLAQGEY